MSDGAVYVIGEMSLLPIKGEESLRPRAVKIGYSADGIKGVRRRLSALRVGTPEVLELLVAYGPIQKDDELAAHRAFSSARLRGEWFSYGVDSLLDRFADCRDESEAREVWRLVHERAGLRA